MPKILLLDNVQYAFKRNDAMLKKIKKDLEKEYKVVECYINEYDIIKILKEDDGIVSIVGAKNENANLFLQNLETIYLPHKVILLKTEEEAIKFIEIMGQIEGLNENNLKHWKEYIVSFFNVYPENFAIVITSVDRIAYGNVDFCSTTMPYAEWDPLTLDQLTSLITRFTPETTILEVYNECTTQK